MINLPASFAGFFSLASDIHLHATRHAESGNLYIPDTDSVRYGRNSIKVASVFSWNNFIKINPGVDLLGFSRSKFKKFIVNHFLDNYTDMVLP